ncbi:MAG TPA: DUF427 domain-containing protein [Gaiellaceae bacterium]|nr:DUF427 domain-containing protein [Gaiellaceae bacterium]
MGLTTGTGPFGPRRAGRLSFEPPERVVYVEPWPRRVRAFANGSLVVDSERSVLVHETSRLPRYAFPTQDVSITAGVEPEPEVAGYVTVPWAAADRWLEEDEELVGHPHDPFHRIEVLRSSRPVCVRIGDEVVAESTRPRILFETALPARYYLPREDVRMDLLEPSPLRTVCAYKGQATYWNAAPATGRGPAAAWSYEEPLHEAEPVRDLLCFFQERHEIAIEVDGIALETPETSWSGTAWIEAALATSARAMSAGRA